MSDGRRAFLTLQHASPPKRVRREVLTYFRAQHIIPYDARELIEELPYQLRLKLMYHIYSSIVYRVLFLRHSAGKDLQDIPFITSLCTRFTEQVTNVKLLCQINTNCFFLMFFRLTVIPGPPLFPLTVQLLDPFRCRVEFIKDIQ